MPAVNPTATKPSWGEISFEYLSALVGAKVPVRAITIGASFVRHKDDHRRRLQWSHWNTLDEAFARSMGSLRLNIVCSPMDLVLGTQLTRRAVAPPSVPGAPTRLDTDTGMMPDDTIYHPSTALSSLWTDGVCNVAIVALDLDADLGAGERAALARYEHVVTPESPDALWAAGITAARMVPPADFAEYVACLEL